MIISASRRTDIPTFYGAWFVNRLRAGYCTLLHPFNQRILRVSLDAGAVDGFVFWTKNVGPFLKHLPEVETRGFRFILQHTCIFRLIPATDSEGKRPPIPIDSGHRFRGKAPTHSD